VADVIADSALAVAEDLAERHRDQLGQLIDSGAGAG
jgi:hypothetical protein